ncbi:MAG: hypothetical protein NVS3B9_1680 [Candidatus Doudnabacteria bacterium]
MINFLDVKNSKEEAKGIENIAMTAKECESGKIENILSMVPLLVLVSQEFE